MVAPSHRRFRFAQRDVFFSQFDQVVEPVGTQDDSPQDLFEYRGNTSALGASLPSSQLLGREGNYARRNGTSRKTPHPFERWYTVRNGIPEHPYSSPWLPAVPSLSRPLPLLPRPHRVLNGLFCGPSSSLSTPFP